MKNSKVEELSDRQVQDRILTNLRNISQDTKTTGIYIAVAFWLSIFGGIFVVMIS